MIITNSEMRSGGISQKRADTGCSELAAALCSKHGVDTIPLHPCMFRNVCNHVYEGLEELGRGMTLRGNKWPGSLLWPVQTCVGCHPLRENFSYCLALEEVLQWYLCVCGGGGSEGPLFMSPSYT